MDWGRRGAWRLFWDAFHASLRPGLVGAADAVRDAWLGCARNPRLLAETWKGFVRVWRAVLRSGAGLRHR